MDTFALTDGEFGISFIEPRRGINGMLETFVVCIKEPGLVATVKVENSPMIKGPETLFKDIAAHWRGWSGEKSWYALERELELVATSDSLGHIKIQVHIRPDASSETWRASSFAYLEAGQLDTFSKRAQAFFGREP